MLAALAVNKESCVVRNVLKSEDTEVMIDSLQRLGFRFQVDWHTSSVRFDQNLQGIELKAADLFVSNSGTSMRFLTAVSSLGKVPIRLDGIARMRERPIEDLLDALRQLGVNVRSENNNGCPPVIIQGTGAWKWKAQRVKIRGTISSQFLSALMLAAPFGTDEDLEIALRRAARFDSLCRYDHPDAGTIWDTYAPWRFDVFREFRGVEPAQPPAEYNIEPDASAASYFFAAAAILQGRVTVLDLPEDSLQGDVDFVDALEQMGCRVEKCASGITVHGGPLKGIDIDMNAISDTVMTLAAVACFADGPTTIRNVAPHSPQGDGPHFSVGDRASKSWRDGGRVFGWVEDHAGAVAWCRHRHLQRSSHGDEHGPDRFAQSREL